MRGHNFLINVPCLFKHWTCIQQTVEMNVSLAGVDGVGWLTLELNVEGVN